MWNDERGERIPRLNFLPTPRFSRGRHLPWTRERFVPATLLATPRAQFVIKSDRDPAYQPQPKGNDREEEMHAMVDVILLEQLIMPTSRAISADPVFCHTD